MKGYADMWELPGGLGLLWGWFTEGNLGVVRILTLGSSFCHGSCAVVLLRCDGFTPFLAGDAIFSHMLLVVPISTPGGSPISGLNLIIVVPFRLPGPSFRLHFLCLLCRAHHAFREMRVGMGYAHGNDHARG